MYIGGQSAEPKFIKVNFFTGIVDVNSNQVAFRIIIKDNTVLLSI